jgi:subtilisin family serine protease
MENLPTWNIEQVWGSDRFYHEGDVASNQIAFVIDSGISLLDDLNVNLEWSKSFVYGFPDPFDDIVGHGTAVASIIGAKANYEGLTGVAPGAELVALRVFGDQGWSRSRDIEAALLHAKEVIIENNLQDRAVVNMSLSGGRPSNQPLVEEMADLGIKFAISAGNSGRDVDGFSPASYGHHENVYVASSITEGGTYSSFTNFDGLDLNGEDDSDFTAPGSGVPTYNTDGTVKFRNGTSFSAPHLAGVLLMSEKVRPGQTFEMDSDQVEKGMIPDPLGMFDPYTYKHGPIFGDPTPLPPPESIPPYLPPITPFPTDEKKKIRGDSFDNRLIGGDNRDRIRGLKGDDIIFGFDGDDLIRGGKGNDILSGGRGHDVIIGGIGINTFRNEKDRFIDTISTRVDGDPLQADIYEGLDSFDRIQIQDAYDNQISVSHTANGIGIFVNGVLEGLYTGENLSVDQVDDMTFGVV